MKNKLHILSFDVPYPPDYGGVIDVFYKIRAFHELGVEINLHCFDYGRGKQPDLEKFCSSVKYYKRDMSKLKLLDTKPFIAATRLNNELLNNILDDNHPVLLEGLHLGAYINKIKEKNKKVFVRAHNIEHVYYKGLAKAEKSIVKKIFFYLESSKLKGFETNLSLADGVFSISLIEDAHFKTRYNNSFLVPAFHPSAKNNYQQF